jgi:hypothetical protein
MEPTLATRYWRGEGGGGVRFAAGGGQGHPRLDGRPAQDRVAPCLPGRRAGGGQGCRMRGGFQGHRSPAAAGGGQGHSKTDGRPATARVALLFPGSPLGPTTFRMLRGGAISPVGGSRGSQPERRSERRTAAVRYGRAGGNGEVSSRCRPPGGVRWAAAGPLVDLMWCLQLEAKVVGQVGLAIRIATLSFQLPKSPFLTQNTPTSTRRR